ncbi:MAG: hypothetical protein Q8Q20_04150 [bacterium]|nr:hypothetical protein [bacterium]
MPQKKQKQSIDAQLFNARKELHPVSQTALTLCVVLALGVVIVGAPAHADRHPLPANSVISRIAGESTSLLFPENCTGWTGADNTRSIDATESHGLEHFTMENSAVFMNNAETSADIDQAPQPLLTCGSFGFDDTLPESLIVRSDIILSFAADTFLNNEDVIIFSYTLNDWQTWTVIDSFALFQATSNVAHDGYWQASLPKLPVAELKHLQVRAEYNAVPNSASATAYLDGIGLRTEIGAEEISAIPTDTVTLLQADYRPDEKPMVSVQVEERPFFTWLGQDRKKLSVRSFHLIDPEGNTRTSDIHINRVDEGSKTYEDYIISENNFTTPGEYRMVFEVQQDNQLFEISQPFNWGALVFTTTQSNHRTGEAVMFSLSTAVINESKFCDAEITVRVEGPRRFQAEISTENGGISRSENCGPFSESHLPDYTGQFTPEHSGEYHFQIEASVDQHHYSLLDNIMVVDDPPFTVTRIGPTRVLPGQEYNMFLEVAVYEDYLGSISESLPSSFTVSNVSGEGTVSPVSDTHQSVHWLVEWQAGQTYSLSYSFKSPNKVPAVHTFDPISTDTGLKMRSWIFMSNNNVNSLHFSPPVESTPVEIILEKNSIREEEIPIVHLRSPDPVLLPPINVVEVNLFTPKGEAAAVPKPEIVSAENGVDVVVPHPSDFHPGKYRIEIKTIVGEERLLFTEEILWGVVAVNVRRSVTKPEIEQQVHLAVLDDLGRTVCDSSIEASITGPDGLVQNFSTEEGSVFIKPDCVDRSVTNDPDYWFYHTGTVPGEYLVEVTAVTDEGTRGISDTFHRSEEYDFEVERSAFPTRIYPVADYPVEFNITPRQDFTGSVTETLPASFVLSDISNDGRVEAVDSETVSIVWDVDWIAGETRTIGYTFDAPNIAPYLYHIGPLTFTSDGSAVFSEYRQWQIASDATKIWDGGHATSANWSTCQNWNNDTCPSTGDDIVFDGTSNDASTWDGFLLTTNFGSITVTSMSGVMTFSNSTATVTGDFSHTSTGNVVYTQNLTVGGNYTLTTSGSLTPNTATLTLNGTGGKNINTTKTHYNLTINPASAATVNMVTNDFTVSNTLSVASGDTLSLGSGRTLTLSLASGTSLTLDGTISDTGTLIYQSSTAFPTSGTFSAGLRLDTTASNRSLPARTFGGIVEIYSNSASTRTVTLGTAGSQTITIGSHLHANAANTANLVVTGLTNAPTMNISGDVDFVGVGSGSERIITGAGTWTVGGNFDLRNGTLFTASSGNEIILTGVNVDVYSTDRTFYDLTFNPSSASTFNFDGSSGISNTLSVGSNANVAFVDSADYFDLVNDTTTSLVLNGEISGDGFVYYYTTETFPATGTMNAPVYFYTLVNMVIPGRTFGSDVWIEGDNGSDITVTFGTAGGQTITINGYLDIGALSTGNQIIDAATHNPNVTIGDRLDFIGAGAGTEIINAGAGTWTVSGDVNFSNGEFNTESGNTFRMNGTSKTLTSNSESFINFAITGGRVTTIDALDVNGTFDVSGGGTFVQGDNVNLSVAGNFTLASGTTFDNADGTGTVTLDGDLTFTDSNSTKQDIGAIFIGTSPDTTNLASDLVAKGLTVNSGDVLNTNGYDLDIGSSGMTVIGTLDATDDVETDETFITTAGKFEIQSTATFTQDQSTITFDATSGTHDLITDGSFSLYNLIIDDGGGGSLVVEVEDPLDVDNNLTITDGTLDVVSGENNQITVGGDWDNDDVFEDRSGTVVFDATDSNNLVHAGGNGADKYFNNVTFSGAGGGNGTWTADEYTNVDAIIDVNDGDTLTVGSGISIFSRPSGTVTLNTSGTINGSGELAIMNSNLATTGTVSVPVRFHVSSATDITMPARTYGNDVYPYTFAFTPVGTIIMASGTHTIQGDMEFYESAGEGTLLDGATNDPTVSIDGNITRNTGTPDLYSGTGTWTISGNVDFTSTTLTTEGTNTFVLDGATKTLDCQAQTFINLTIDGTYTGQNSDCAISSALVVNTSDQLTLGSGVNYTWSGSTFTLDGAIAGDGRLIVSTTTTIPTSGTLSSVVRFDVTSAGGITMPARTYGDDVEAYTNSATFSSEQVTMGAGTHEINGSLYVIVDDNQVVHLTGESNNPSVDVAGDLDFTGSGGSDEQLTTGTGTWSVGGSVDFTAGTVAVTAGNTLVMDGTGTLTSDSETLRNVTLSGSITLANATHTINGNFSMAGGTITDGTSTVAMTGTSNTIVGGGNTLYNLTIDPSFAGTITLQTSDLTVDQVLTVAVDDALSIDSGRNLTLAKTSGTSLTLNGTVSGSGRLIYSSSDNFPIGGTLSSVLRFNATSGDQNMTSRTYGNTVELYNNGSSLRSVLVLGNTTINGSWLLIADGTGNVTLAESPGTIDHAISGDFDFTGTGGGSEVIQSGSGTWTVSGNVDFTGGSTQMQNTISMDGSSKTITSGSQTIFNFEVSGGSVASADAMDVNGTFSVTSGTFTQNDNADLNVADDFTLSNGVTFDDADGTGLLVLDGDLTFTDNTVGTSVGTVEVGTSPDTTDLASDMVAKGLTVNSGDVLNTNGYDIDIGASGLNVIGTLDATDDVETDETTVNVAGNVTFDGASTFTQDQSIFILDGSSTQTITSGGRSFYDLTITNSSGSYSGCSTSFTPGVDFADSATVGNDYTITTNNVKVEYNSGSTYTITNINWSASSGNDIVFRNSNLSSGTWLLDVSGTQTDVSYVNVGRSDASGGDQIDASNGTNTDCNNNTNWLFVAGVTLSGVAYTNEGISPLDGSSVNKTVNLLVNGSGSYTDEITDSSGAWSIPNVAAVSTDIVTVFLDNETEEATTVYVSDGTAQTNVDLYQNTVIVRADTGSISNANLNTGDSGDDDIKYNVSGSNVTFNSGFELHIWSGDTYQPSGWITTQAADIHIAGGTLTMAGNYIIAGGGWDNDGSFSQTTNYSTTFNASSGTYNIDADGTGGDTFRTVDFNDGGGSAEWNLTTNMTSSQDVTILGGTLDFNGSNTLSVGGDFTNRDTMFESTGTLTMTAGSGTNYIDTSEAASPSATNFNNINFNDGGGSATFQSRFPLDVNGDLTNTNGTFDLSAPSTWYLTSDSSKAYGSSWRLKPVDPAGSANDATKCDDGGAGPSGYCMLIPGSVETIYLASEPTDITNAGWMLNNGLPFSGTFASGTWSVDITSVYTPGSCSYGRHRIGARLWKTDTDLANPVAITGWVFVGIGSGTNDYTINFTGIGEQVFEDDILYAEFYQYQANPTCGGSTPGQVAFRVNQGGSLQKVNSPAFSPEITLAGDWTNSDIFTHGSSEIVLDGSGTQTLSGTMTSASSFYDLSATNTSGSFSGCAASFTPGVDFAAAATVANDYAISTGDVKVEYNSGSTYTMNNVDWDGSTHATPIVFRNSNLSSGTWLLDVSGTQTVKYVNVARSDASSGSTIDATHVSNVDCQNTTNWDFDAIQFSISDNDIGFGTLNTAEARFATGDTNGTDTKTAAHTFTVRTSADDGYIITYFGSLMQSGSDDIDAGSITNDDDGNEGTTEEFGIGITTDGDTTIASGYDANSPADYSFVADTTTIIASETGSTAAEIISAYSIANITGLTPAGSYETNITYIMTSNF